MNHIDQRREAAQGQPTAIPCGAGRSQTFKAPQLRGQTVERDGKSFYELDGYASVTEVGYEMYDMFGPYTEVIDAGAFDETLRSDPDVAFLLNHRGLTMASTKNQTLELSVDETGLHSLAWLNPTRSDVKDLVSAIDDGLITEMSFAFRITDGQWSPDWSEYRIKAVDLNRGDVSAVNYGANPHTSIMARQNELMAQVEQLQGAALAAAYERLAQRVGTPVERPREGRSVALLRALSEFDRV